MALLNGKEDVEAKAWTRLQRMAQLSPWARQYSLKEIEESWSQWESKGRQVRPLVSMVGAGALAVSLHCPLWLLQVSKVVGAAYKPKERSQSARLLPANVNYSSMKQQVRQHKAHPCGPGIPLLSVAAFAHVVCSRVRDTGHRQFWQQAGLARVLATAGMDEATVAFLAWRYLVCGSNSFLARHLTVAIRVLCRPRPLTRLLVSFLSMSS